MGETRTAGATLDTADPGRPIQAAFQAAIKRATSDLKGLVTLIGALAGLAVAYYAFQDKLKLHEPWPTAICGGAFLVFFLLFLLPEVREQLKLQRLRVNGIRGRIIDPKYFRLGPYETDDAQSFKRPRPCENVCEPRKRRTSFSIAFIGWPSAFLFSD